MIVKFTITWTRPGTSLERCRQDKEKGHGTVVVVGSGDCEIHLHLTWPGSSLEVLVLDTSDLKPVKFEGQKKGLFNDVLECADFQLCCPAPETTL